MPDYAAPLSEMRFVLRHVCGLDALRRLGGRDDLTDETMAIILGEAGRFAREVLAPLNAVGDREGARFDGATVAAPPGYAEAYRAFAAAGWNGISAPAAHGGQNLPRALALVVEEMWNSANLAFALAPMLTAGVVQALSRHGSPAQQALYLPPLVSGRWCGTMNLTEPHAGSDLSMLRTVATPGRGAYRLRGTKAFITWGEHDLAENIVHLVLARTPDAPPGVKGLSLFVVPKYLVSGDGSLGERNDIDCVALERKAGLHGSPTCLLKYGEREGAVGHLVGEAGRGLEYMFTMMNHARLGVGVEGVALAERAYQAAAAYAAVRMQGRDVVQRSGDVVPIRRHPDVRRMLLSMKCRIEAMRALACHAAAADDLAREDPSADARRQWQARADLLTPVIKGWCTEQAVDIAALGMQVHGGAGYVEDTGVAQYWRDARVTPIYEGTTGIQANDLVGRKIAGDGGAAARAHIQEMRADLADARALDADPGAVSAAARAVDHLERATRCLLAASPAHAAAVAVPYLHLYGTVCGAWMSVRAAAAATRCAGEPEAPAPAAKLALARFYAQHVLSAAAGLAQTVEDGAAVVLQWKDDWL